MSRILSCTKELKLRFNQTGKGLAATTKIEGRRKMVRRKSLSLWPPLHTVIGEKKCESTVEPSARREVRLIRKRRPAVKGLLLDSVREGPDLIVPGKRAE